MISLLVDVINLKILQVFQKSSPFFFKPKVKGEVKGGGGLIIEMGNGEGC